MQTFSVDMTFANGSRTKIVGGCVNVNAARAWARAHCALDKTRVVKIETVDDIDGSRDTIWHRDWTDESNRAGMADSR